MAQEMDADGNGLISRQEFEDTLTDERASGSAQHPETHSLSYFSCELVIVVINRDRLFPPLVGDMIPYS